MSITRFMINWLRTSSTPRRESAHENTTELDFPSRARRGHHSKEDIQKDMKKKYRCGISLLFTCSSSSRSKPNGCPPEKLNACPPEKPKGCPPEKPKPCPPEKPKELVKPKIPEKPKQFWPPKESEKPKPFWSPESPTGCSPMNPNGCSPKKMKEPEKPKRFWPPKEPEKPKPKPFWPPENPKGCSPGNPKGCSPGNPKGCSPGNPNGCSPGNPKGCSPGNPKGCSPGNPHGCSPGNPNGCSPGNPNGCSPGNLSAYLTGNPNGCSPGKSKESSCWNDWSNEDRSEWQEKFEALYGLSVLSDHTMYGDYGPIDDFDAMFQDHNPANFDEQRNINEASVGLSSIPRPPTSQQNHHVINKMMEKDHYSGTTNSVALEYSRNQNDIVLEVESNTDYNSCGQNDNVMIDQIQNEDSDTDFEETDQVLRPSSNTKPARADNRRTKKISISLEDIHRHFKMNMDDAAKSLDVSRSTLKRICREYDIQSWPTRRRGKKINDEKSSIPKKVNPNDQYQTDESTMSRALTISRPLMQEASNSSNNSIVTIKATYGEDMAKFSFTVSSGLNSLKEKVCQRLGINILIKLKCMDNDGDLIVISCDDALHELFGKRLPRSTDHNTTTFDFKVFEIKI